MKIYSNFLEILTMIQERKLITWKEVAFDIGIAYATMLRLIKEKGSRPMEVKTKRKIHEYIDRNKKYIEEE